MSTSIKTDHYVTLLNDITALYDVARHAQVEAYWQIGKRIVEEEQLGQENAVYGHHLLDQLSKDLSEILGRGFSVRNLYNMRQFYLTHEISQAPAKLNWAQYVELLPVRSKTMRRKLEKRVADQNLSSRQVRQVVREMSQDTRESSRTSPATKPATAIPTLVVARKPLQRYSLVDQSKIQYPRGMVVVDCGFDVWRSLSGSEGLSLGEASFTYPATVESVIDGDTLWAVIDCGFDTFIREKLRFRGIDTPELGTPEGDKARQYVKRTLKACPCIVVQTHKTDKYARYLSDIFYLPGSKEPAKIGREGQVLNQELLDKGLARPWKP
jgi:endonuclease YncB( thermonuclease family)